MILYVIAEYCNERRRRYSLCMLRFRSPTTSFEVASSMARECHGWNECSTDRREMRRKPKKTWCKTPLPPRRKKDGKGRRRSVHYRRGLRVSRTQLDERRTAAQRRLDDDCCGWPPARRETEIVTRLRCARSSSAAARPARTVPHSFSTRKLRRLRRRRRTPTDVSRIFPRRPSAR